MSWTERDKRLTLVSAIAIEAMLGLLILMKYTPQSNAIGLLMAIEVGSWILFHKYHDNYADWRINNPARD